MAGVAVLDDAAGDDGDGASASEGFWGSPIVVHTHTVEAEAGSASADSSEIVSEAEGAAFHRMPTSSFTALVVPLVIKGSGRPLPIPKEYGKAISTVKDSVRALRRTIRDMGLEDTQRKELQAAVQASFREWLASSGQLRQVTDLVRLQREATRHAKSASSS